MNSNVIICSNCGGAVFVAVDNSPHPVSLPLKCGTCGRYLILTPRPN
ncbi:putative ZnF domain protein [Aedes albopictus anphevirus]|uniref:ZnF domain protein n=1 Tax=Aedes albopictus anphevirus TaxID=2783999 RepID=A0A7S6UDK6_9MONO|nr:putative ZnF domain protein [Aedes albopictus anphevirus]WOV63952.1 putative ZnF domain protein [Aedes albopictus anphevirus]WOX58859.1 putative ZnF domain protein [Aedes albopictus anphevirus]BEP11668.1 putative ZnF domain protein [Aedes albopictus anphevirus]